MIEGPKQNKMIEDEIKQRKLLTDGKKKKTGTFASPKSPKQSSTSSTTRAKSFMFPMSPMKSPSKKKKERLMLKDVAHDDADGELAKRRGLFGGWNSKNKQ